MNAVRMVQERAELARVAARYGIRQNDLHSYSTNNSDQPLLRYKFPNGYDASVLLVDHEVRRFDVWAGHSRFSPVQQLHRRLGSTETNLVLSEICALSEILALPVERPFRDMGRGMLIRELLEDSTRRS